MRTRILWTLMNPCNDAARRGDIEDLGEFRSQWTEETCAIAAREGHLNVVKWLRKNGCPWNDCTISWSARTGQLKVIQWAVKNLCTIDSLACAFAAQAGHLHVLEWMVENEFPWCKDNCLMLARRNGRKDVVKWLKKTPYGDKEFLYMMTFCTK
jgi:hypothetical protein